MPFCPSDSNTARTLSTANSVEIAGGETECHLLQNFHHGLWRSLPVFAEGSDPELTSTRPPETPSFEDFCFRGSTDTLSGIRRGHPRAGEFRYFGWKDTSVAITQHSWPARRDLVVCPRRSLLEPQRGHLQWQTLEPSRGPRTHNLSGSRRSNLSPHTPQASCAPFKTSCSVDGMIVLFVDDTSRLVPRPNICSTVSRSTSFRSTRRWRSMYVSTSSRIHSSTPGVSESPSLTNASLARFRTHFSSSESMPLSG